MQKYVYFQYVRQKKRKNLLIGDVQHQILGAGADADLWAPDA